MALSAINADHPRCLNSSVVASENPSVSSRKNSVESLISLLKRAEDASRRPGVMNEAATLCPGEGTGKRTYSLYSTDSDSTITGTKKNMDKVSRLISLLLGKEVALDDDFDETLVANEVIEHLGFKVDKENAKPEPLKKTHERKNSKNFPKTIKRKTISVKNVKPKVAIAVSMKQHQNRLKESQKTHQEIEQPKRFVRPCCQQPLEDCVHKSKEVRLGLKPSVATWNATTPATTPPRERNGAVSVEKFTFTKSAVSLPTQNIMAGDCKEIPVRDSDPDPAAFSLSPSKAVQAEINEAGFKEGEYQDDLQTFHSQRRALRFLLNELKDVLKSKYLELDSHASRILEAVDKIVSMMQKANYVTTPIAPPCEEDASTTSFSSVDVDLALQPLRNENASLRTRLRQISTSHQTLQKESEALTRIFDDVEGLVSCSSIKVKAISVKEKLIAYEKEISLIKKEVDLLQSEKSTLVSERQDLLRLMGAKDGDADKVRLDALEESSRLRKDVERYEQDLARSAINIRERDERLKVMNVTLKDRENEIVRLKDLVHSLQRSMTALVEELQSPGPEELPMALPLPLSFAKPSVHLVGPGGDGPFCNIGTECVASAASSVTSIAKKSSDLRIPSGVTDSLREFLEKSNDHPRKISAHPAKLAIPAQSPPPPPRSYHPCPSSPPRQPSVTLSSSPAPSETEAKENDASRFSVSEYLKKYGLQTDAHADRRGSTSITTSTKERPSSAIAQSTPLSTPFNSPTKPAHAASKSKVDLSKSFIPLDDDSTLTGISEISSISAASNVDGLMEDHPGSVSSLASQDELQFRAGLQELDASIQRLKFSLKK